MTNLIAEARELKYPKEDYEQLEMYGCYEDDVTDHRQKVVKCRRSHKCVGCNKEIRPGDFAVNETGFMADVGPVSCYTCITCCNGWLDDLNEEDEDDERFNHRSAGAVR